MGDFAGARSLLDAFADLDTSIVRGMLELLSGHVPEARQAFDLALRNRGKGKTVQMDHAATFPGLLHALLLVQSDQLQDRQQVRTWVDWFDKHRGVEAYGDAYRVLGLLLAFHEGREPQDSEDWWLLHSRNMPLAYVGTCLVQLLYQLYTSKPRTSKKQKDVQGPALEEFLHVCQQQGARWPVVQIARLMHKLGMGPASRAAEAEAFFKDTLAKDLSELWTVKEIWETRVGALEQLLQEAQRTAEAPATVQTRRLAWKLYEVQPEEIVVIPVEQKRTKNGGWTKGREVPLQRLINHQVEGLDYLTEQDHAALAGAQKTGRYYYDYMYRLDPGRALQALAGHPNVFWEDRPHLPVEIVRGTPEVHIVPQKGQVSRSSWIPIRPSTTRTACARRASSRSRPAACGSSCSSRCT